MRGSGRFLSTLVLFGLRHWIVSIPFIAGQWSLLLDAFNTPSPFDEFQSPSLRCSGRFFARVVLVEIEQRFNPLHCGAVVASSIQDRRRIHQRIGTFQSPSLRGSGRFKKLEKVESDAQALVFQSPSLRGSGRFERGWTRPPTRRSRFQSPSLRGSGRFHPPKAGGGMLCDGFNPLHCGAVVASRATKGETMTQTRFNPLHCGAVVASAPRDKPSSTRCSSFNPLHCGAVVASRIHILSGTL